MASLIRKLLVIPVMAGTVGLAIAFMAPAMASGAVSHLGIGFHFPSSIPGIGLISVSTRAPANISSGSGGGTQLSGANTSSNGLSSTDTVSGSSSTFGHPSDPWKGEHGQHTVATAGKMNCGRFGNGTHGGGHDFICKNTPFPVTHSGTVS